MNREQEINQEIEDLHTEKQSLKSRRMITCLNCQKRTSLPKAIIIRTHWYTQPHGCTGGDYWNFGEYLHVCLKCNHSNRAYIGSWEKHWRTGKIKSKALKDPRVKLFIFLKEHIQYVGEVLDTYDGHDDNKTLDEIREKCRDRDR